MMTKQEYESRDAFDKPEMLQSPLDKLVLQVKHVSKKLSPDTRPSELLQQAIQPPDINNIEAAVKNLADMGAITRENCTLACTAI